MIITLLTDFGLSDGYVAAMKGVILGVAPEVTLVDITHDIAPQNIDQAAFVLHSAYAFFPENTLHLVVVDPGVGSGRRILAVYTGLYTFLAPDNGVLKYIFDAVPDPQVYEVTRSELFLDEVSSTFHGRDIFAPVAARLITGLPLEQVGSAVTNYERGSVCKARREKTTIYGEIIHFDRFGNGVTNIPGEWVKEGQIMEILCRKIRLPSIVFSYSQVRSNLPLALIGSHDRLEIAIRDGNAERQLKLRKGDTIHVTFKQES